MSGAINLVLYEAGWFACVLALAWGKQWIGVTVALSLVAVHLFLATDRYVQIKLCLASAVMGFAIDTAQLALGVFRFPETTFVEGLPPPAIVVLWLQFATTFRYCLHWLSGRYVLGAIVGLLGAPLAFFAGERLGAVIFLSPRVAHYSILGLMWSAAVPLLVYLADRWGAQGNEPAAYRWPRFSTHENESDLP